MYNDFNLIDEKNLNKMVEEYNKRLKVKIQNEDEFITKLKSLFYYLQNCIHYIKNLTNYIKNTKNLEKINGLNKSITEVETKLKLLYDFQEAEVQKEDETNFETNYNLILCDITNNLILAIDIIFDFICFEDNIKIKTSLQNLFKELLEDLKEINNIKLYKPKVFSLFKRY